jgi:pyrroline-5-carboxylate reductase
MPKVLEKLKDKLVARGMPKSNAYAVATSALQKQGKMKRDSQELTKKGKGAK